MQLIVQLILYVIFVAGLWKVFEKAGKPAWLAIIPIVNYFMLIPIAGKPLWWIILFLIPIVNIIVIFIVGIEVAKKFGKGTGFGVGLVLLGVVFYPILGFGDAKYMGGAAVAAPPVQTPQ